MSMPGNESSTSTSETPPEKYAYLTDARWDALIQEHINETNLKDPEEIEHLYYYKRTVYPGLVAGISKLLKERPSDQLGFLAAFLLKYKKDMEKQSVIEK